MNTSKKYCPNVFVAACSEEYNKGDIITVTTKYGKENEHVVHNKVGTTQDGLIYYSITRYDGFDSRERAKAKADRLEGYADNQNAKATAYRHKSEKDKDFLGLGEPIKIGHHSEKRHRRIIEQAQNNTDKMIYCMNKADSYSSRIAYWEEQAKKIDLSMPESVSFYTAALEDAVRNHKDLKDNPEKRKHSYSLTYAKKKVNEMKKKCITAQKLWGEL